MGRNVVIDYDSLHLSRRIWARVSKPNGEAGCWLYPATEKDGYARIHAQGHVVVAHRLFYSVLVGPVPSDLTLDHLCRVRNCVNPAHIEPVPHKENVQRGNAGLLHRIKTHCRNGHEYNESNTYRAPDGSRNCRICNGAAAARYKERKAA
jgi:HNH endonuclease